MTSKQNKARNDKTELLPVRYFLDSSAVASCFAALGKGRPSAKLFSALPEANANLPETVCDKQGRLSREAAILFDILLNPTSVMTLEMFAANSRYGYQLTFAIDNSGSFFVAISEEADGVWDLALLTGIDQLLAVVDEVTGLSRARDSAGSFAKTLPIPGLAALAAFSDLVRYTQIQSELQRSSPAIDYLISPINAVDLLQMITIANQQPDMRSAVSKLAYCSDGAILAVQSVADLETGIEQLQQAGLIDEDRIISADGFVLAKGLSQAQSIAALAAADIQHKLLTLDRLVVVFLADAILAGVWRLDGEGGLASLTFAEMKAALILSLIRDIAGKKRKANDVGAENEVTTFAKPDIKFCNNCGSKLKAGVKFCANCGIHVK